MIGVTIAVGPKFNRIARANAETIKHHYRVNHVVFLGYAQIAKYCAPRDRFVSDAEHIWSLKHAIPLVLPGVDRWLYFDADYGVINPPEPDVVDVLHSDTRFVGVEDTDTNPEWRATCPPGFLNAGFFVANRVWHDAVFAWCRENYWTVPDRRWGDQNVMNHALNVLGVEKRILPLKYNTMKTAMHTCPEPVASHGYWHVRSAK